ncbi:MAG: hypothetical protein K6U09_12810 [Acidobacteriia bacterium]|nr:hypothetical protein [Terriglobia bacterium]
MRIDLSRVVAQGGTAVAEQVGEVDGVPVYRCEAGGALACRLASAQYGGQWWWSNDGVCWVLGKRRAYALWDTRVDAVLRARGVAHELGVDVQAWSVGGVARECLRWVGEREQAGDCGLRAVDGRWHYYRVRVGEGVGVLWDMDAAYYQVLLRLPSPHVLMLGARRWLWQHVPSEQESRWRGLLGAVADYKLLRNACVGAMLGGGSVVCAMGGEWRRLRTPVSAWAGTGAVVVRSVYEACGLASVRGGACYANTDCVLLDGDAVPAVWDDYGLLYSARARGAYDVRGVGVYRVGDVATQPYLRRAWDAGVSREASGAWSEDVARAWLAWLRVR